MQSGRSSSSTTGQRHHSQGCNNYGATAPTLQISTQHRKIQHQWISAQLTTAVGIKEKARKEGPSERKRQASRQRIQQFLQQQRKGKGGYHPIGQGNPCQQRNPFKGASTPNNMKGKGRSKGKDTCYKCGQQGRIKKNCRVAVYNFGNDEHQQWENDHHMTGIKTSINKDMIKDGTTKIGNNKDMSKGINNQQHRRSHHHQHRQHQQAWHSPSVQWRTST